MMRNKDIYLFKTLRPNAFACICGEKINFDKLNGSYTHTLYV